MKKLVTTFATCLLAAQISAAEVGEQEAPASASVETFREAASSNEVAQADIDEQNSLSDASTKDITPQTLNDFFDEFADKHNINYGESRDGKSFFTGRATVAMSETDPAFAKALNIAFDEAMLNMQAEFVRENFGRQSTITRQKLFNDDSTNAREFEKLPAGSKVAQVFEKITQLAGAKLDSALAELGVTDIESLTEERKKVLLADSFVQETTTRAFGNMQGLVPVQTSITKADGSSNYEVGVIAVMSDKTRQVAIDMRHKRASLIKGKGRELKSVLPVDSKGFLAEHGIRLVYNQDGAPVIISYGQWSYLPESDGYINNRKREAASEQAMARADSAVADFINRSVDFKRSAETGKQIERSITEVMQSGDARISEKMATEIIEITNKEVFAQSDMNLRGLRTLKNWSAKDDNGVQYVGVVRFYSHDNVLNSNRMVEPVKPATAKPAASQGPAKSVSTKSRVVNDMDDF